MAPTVGDVLFIDTNVLLTATVASRSEHDAAVKLFNRAGHQGLHLAASGQVFREYLVVATRPIDANGLGLNVRDAAANVHEFLGRMRPCDETEEVSRRLRQLALTYDVHGKRLHDANIVATMTAHGIRVLVTQNADDFTPFNEIEAVAVTDVSVEG